MEMGGTGSWGRKRMLGVESESEAGKRSEVKGIQDGGGLTRKWKWVGPEGGVGSGSGGLKVKVKQERGQK